MSLLSKFDELMRNSQVLQTSCEQQFLNFVTNTDENRHKWEVVELECQRLEIELNKANQEREGLETKLLSARDLLDTEVKLRKKAEADRDKLKTQLALVRELIMDDNFGSDAKLNKIRILGNPDYDDEDNFHLDNVVTPKGILKRNTEDFSVVDIDDLSFDDEETGVGDFSRRSHKRSRSRSRSRPPASPTHILNNLENVASPRKDRYDLRKRARRSRSVVAFNQQPSSATTSETTSTDENDIRPRSYSATTNTNNLDVGFHAVQDNTNADTCHNFIQKTVLKSELCSACSKRIGFGRVAFKCSRCKIMVHNECSDQAPGFCVPDDASPDVCKTPSGVQRSRSTKKKPMFASPMLR